jgi:hypothetical protein
MKNEKVRPTSSGRTKTLSTAANDEVLFPPFVVLHYLRDTLNLTPQVQIFEASINGGQ